MRQALSRRPAPRLVLTALAVAIPLSQLGHSLAYLVRYGGVAVVRQGSGAHAYFPAALEAAGSVLGFALLAALFLIAAGRLMTSLRSERPLVGGWPLWPLVAVLFAVQAGIFLGQELLEANLNGLRPDAPGGLAAGLLSGHLPVALAAAVGLRWLSSGVAEAVNALREAGSKLRLRRGRTVSLASWPAGGQQSPAGGRATTCHERGPPRLPIV